MKTIMSWVGKNALYIALIQAIAATLGSLYFSEIAHFPPCVLCWYQRVCIYPMVVILLVGILRKDRLVHLYVLPLAIIGWIIAVFHNLLYYNIIPEAAAPCVAGISCTTKFIEWFGFVTIPFLSFTALTVMIVLMWLHRNYVKNEVVIVK